VAEVYPESVAYDNDGKPYTVRYQYLAAMLLNEVQKEYRRADEQSAAIEMQQKQIEAQGLVIAAQAAQMQQQTRAIESLKQQLQLSNAALR
jgi:hypothetical protein